MEALTKKQQGVLNFLRAFMAQNHYAPSYMEIANGLGFASKNTVFVYLNYLQNKGYLTHARNVPRSIVLLDGESAE